jgi:hypothetical protein
MMIFFKGSNHFHEPHQLVSSFGKYKSSNSCKSLYFLSNSGVNPFCSSIDFTIASLRLAIASYSFEVWQCVQFVLHLDFQWYLFDIGNE